MAELRRLLRKLPDTETMEILVPDILGILRGKRVRRQSFEKTCTEGFMFPAGSILMNAIGDFVPGMIGESDGDPDTPCALISGSMAPVPWSSRPAAQALFRVLDEDGRPFFADPRAVLERSLQPLQKTGLKVVMATELEFYLLDAKAAKPSARSARVPGLGRPQIGPQVYHPDDLWEIEPFLDELYACCEAQGIPADTATSEFAPGQFEINLAHVPDPALACDHAVLLKRAVKAIALRHGFVACFMAKPFAEDAGNGMHIHLSLVDRNGKNYFSHGRENLASPPFSARLRHAVGGLLKTMPEATAIFAITMDDTGQRVLSVSARNVPTEYEVFYTVAYSLVSGEQTLLAPQDLTFTQDYTWDETLVLGKAREEDLMRDAIVQDLVRTVLKQISSL